MTLEQHQQAQAAHRADEQRARDFTQALETATGIKTRTVVPYTVAETTGGQWAVHCHGHQVALEATKQDAESWVLFNA